MATSSSRAIVPVGDHRRHVVGFVLADAWGEAAQRVEHDQAGARLLDQRPQPVEVARQT